MTPCRRRRRRPATEMDWLAHAGLAWLIAAVVLAGAELLVPGVFLVFLAIAAAIVGAVTLLVPALPLAGQLAAFAAWSVVTVLIGRRWYRDYAPEAADPLLNDRIARLIGDTAVVSQPIAHGVGRVRVGDGEWIARGPDAPAGTRVRITGGHGATLTVVPNSD